MADATTKVANDEDDAPVESQPSRSHHSYSRHPEFSWEAPEHAYTEKGPDWFWIVGIVTTTLAIAAIVYGNILFAVVIVVGAFALVIQSLRRPRTIEFSVGERGVTVDDVLYPHSSLRSFWVEHNPHEQKIIIRSQKTFMPYVVIPIDASTTDPEAVRHYLLHFLPEEEHMEPLSQKVMEYLGF